MGIPHLAASAPSASIMPDCCSPKPESSDTSKSGLYVTFPALLYSSCCWLPILLEGLTISSAAATFLGPFQQLKPILLAVTILLSVHTLRRQGLSRRAILQATLPVLVLLAPAALKAVRTANNAPLQHHGHHRSCH